MSATDHLRHVTIQLNDESRQAVHKATVLWDQQYANDGKRWHNLVPIPGVRREIDATTAWWNKHLAASAECAAHVLLGIMFNPNKYRNYAGYMADVGGVVEVRARRPSQYGSPMIVAQSEIELKPDMPHLLAYVTSLPGQKHAQVTFMGWGYNRDIAGIAYKTHDAQRPGYGLTTHYWVRPTALHPMGTLPKLI